MTLTVKISSADYENVTANCPFCGYRCIFNRASDLRTFEPIGGKNIRCLNKDCHKPFRIVGDTANERHQVLIYDCYKFLRHKQYMHCIVNLVTAYEMFFSLFLRVELLYKPFALERAGVRRLEDLNALARLLGKKINKETFHSMRCLFLNEVTYRQSVKDLSSARIRICSLNVRDTSNCKITAIDDQRLVPLLMELKSSNIGRVRNDVVHKQAYRPTREETEEYFEQAKSIVLTLTSLLDLHDSLNWYIMRSSRRVRQSR